MTKRDDEYAHALGTIDRMHAAGQMSTPEWEVKRARLLSEAANPQASRGQYAARLTGIVVLLFVLLGLLALIVSATSR